MHPLIILSGTSHPEFAQLIADHLESSVQEVVIGKFANGETQFELGDTVRGADVYIVQTSYGEINDMLMELLIMAHTCRLGAAAHITAVLPFFPYARQDRMLHILEPITAKLVANMLMSAGVNHVMAIDLHSPQLQGFFDIPCDNLRSDRTFVQWIRTNFVDLSQLIIVAPDNGAVKMAINVSGKLGVTFALLHKERRKKNEVHDMVLVGDVENKIALVFDDMADTCQTLCKAAERLQVAGALKIYAFVTHGVFSGEAVDRLLASPFEMIVHTNSLPRPSCTCNNPKFHYIDVSHVFKEAILDLRVNQQAETRMTLMHTAPEVNSRRSVR